MRDLISIVESTGFSDAFKRWFGNSKVFKHHPDDPMIVHHFTHTEFTKFEHDWVKKTFPKRDHESIDRVGFWFTDNPEIHYGPKRMDCFLRIEKPFWMDDDKMDCWSQLHNLCVTAGGASYLRQELRDRGYDGIIMTATNLDGHVQNVFIVFDAKQIKSVSNRGNYDLDNDDIME